MTWLNHDWSFEFGYALPAVNSLKPVAALTGCFLNVLHQGIELVPPALAAQFRVKLEHGLDALLCLGQVLLAFGAFRFHGDEIAATGDVQPGFEERVPVLFVGGSRPLGDLGDSQPAPDAVLARGSHLVSALDGFFQPLRIARLAALLIGQCGGPLDGERRLFVLEDVGECVERFLRIRQAGDNIRRAAFLRREPPFRWAAVSDPLPHRSISAGERVAGFREIAGRSAPFGGSGDWTAGPVRSLSTARRPSRNRFVRPRRGLANWS